MCAVKRLLVTICKIVKKLINTFTLNEPGKPTPKSRNFLDYKYTPGRGHKAQIFSTFMETTLKQLTGNL